MDDIVTYALLTASAFFVVLSFVLLARYRQVSQRISASFDLGHDLWEALEARLKKQDERILDMMGRVEVIQSRIVGAQRGEATLGPSALSLPGPEEGRKGKEVAREKSQPETSHVTSQIEPQADEAEAVKALDSRLSKQDERLSDIAGALEAIQLNLASSRATATPASPSSPKAVERTHAGDSGRKVDEKQLISMIAEKARTSVEIRQRFNVSREHASRVLESLFDRGLVIRNDSSKPFVYELTDAGRRYLSAS